MVVPKLIHPLPPPFGSPEESPEHHTVNTWLQVKSTLRLSPLSNCNSALGVDFLLFLSETRNSTPTAPRRPPGAALQRGMIDLPLPGSEELRRRQPWEICVDGVDFLSFYWGQIQKSTTLPPSRLIQKSTPPSLYICQRRSLVPIKNYRPLGRIFLYELVH